MKILQKSSPLRHWLELLGKTSTAQVIIQGTGFLCGIFIIRYLTTEQYAYYTLANSVLATMTLLTDGGISTGVISEGGKVWEDRKKLGRILATGVKLRQSFAIISVSISLPALWYLLNKQGLTGWSAVGLIVAMIPVFWANLTNSILQVIPKLHQKVDELLKINLQINVVRLFCTFALLLIFPLAGLAVLATGAGQVYGNLKLRKLNTANADWSGGSDPEYKKKILRIVKRVLPGTLYYCVSGQITIWLVSIFNDTGGIADVGALTRLMAVLAIVRMTVNLLIIPRFARLKVPARTLITRYFQVVGILFLMGCGIVAFTYLFPKLVLFVLGDKYANLEYELFLITISSCLAMVSEVVYQLSASRGIITNPIFFIPTMIVVQVLSIVFLVDVSSVVGVICLPIYTISVAMLIHMSYFIKQTIKKPTT